MQIPLCSLLEGQFHISANKTTNSFAMSSVTLNFSNNVKDIIVHQCKPHSLVD